MDNNISSIPQAGHVQLILERVLTAVQQISQASSWLPS